MSLKEHYVGYAVGSIGWITAAAYFTLDFIQHGFVISVHSREALLEHILVIGTIPIFMAIGYFTDRKIMLERQLKEYSLQLEQRVVDVTGAKEYLENLIGNIEEGIVAVSRNYIITDVNPAACRMTGRTREEIVGKPCYETNHWLKQPCPQEEWTCPLREISASGLPLKVVHEHFDEKGKKLYVEIYAFPVKNEKGEIAQIVEVWRDVTEKVLLERESELLQKVNHLLNAGASQQEIFETITHGLTSAFGYKLSAIYLLSEDKSKLFCKSYSTDSEIVKKAEKLTGMKALNYAAPLYEGSMLSKVVETKEPVITGDIEVLIEEHTSKKEIKLLAKPLAKIVGIKYGIGVPLLAGDKLVGTVGVGSAEELTDKDAERLARFGRQAGLAVERAALYEDLEEKTKEITKTKDYLQRLIDTSPIAIITTDLEGKILSFSRGAEKMYGYAAEEVLDRRASMLQPGGSYKGLNKEMRNKLMKGEIVENELLNVRKNGEVFLIYLHLRSMLDDKGRPIGTLSLAQDITQRKKMEEELKAYTKQLELNLAKLTEYTFELKKTNELKDLFIDIMRHDLLNPIGIIKNLAEFLATEESLKNLREEIEILQRNVRKLEEIIESTSKLAKIESMEKIEFQKQDLNTILRKVIQSFEPMFKEKGMQVEYDTKGECPARVNPIIEEVFLNLISNAIKYSPEKSKILVSIEDDAGKWKVMVKDNGEGVPDEFKEAIFDRFKRADRMGVKGTGLGLAIVKKLVEMHSGRAWVEDNPEGGSMFCVAIPK